MHEKVVEHVLECDFKSMLAGCVGSSVDTEVLRSCMMGGREW